MNIITNPDTDIDIFPEEKELPEGCLFSKTVEGKEGAAFTVEGYDNYFVVTPQEGSDNGVGTISHVNSNWGRLTETLRKEYDDFKKVGEIVLHTDDPFTSEELDAFRTNRGYRSLNQTKSTGVPKGSLKCIFAKN